MDGLKSPQPTKRHYKVDTELNNLFTVVPKQITDGYVVPGFEAGTNIRSLWDKYRKLMEQKEKLSKAESRAIALLVVLALFGGGFSAAYNSITLFLVSIAILVGIAAVVITMEIKQRSVATEARPLHLALLKFQGIVKTLSGPGEIFPDTLEQSAVNQRLIIYTLGLITVESQWVLLAKPVVPNLTDLEEFVDNLRAARNKVTDFETAVTAVNFPYDKSAAFREAERRLALIQAAKTVAASA